VKIRIKWRSLCAMACVGVLAFVSPKARAQNLFEADGFSFSVNEITPGGIVSSFASGLTDVSTVAFDRAGNLFVACSYGTNGTIIKITPGGVQSTFASGITNPQGLAFDSAGNLFVADFGSNYPIYTNGVVYEFTPGGTRTTFASGFQPVGMAFNRAGDLFVADVYSGNIYEFTPGGTQSTFASPGVVAYGLAFDGAGNLFVSSTTVGLGQDVIYKFTPEGTQSTFASGLSQPHGLAFNSAGILFDADYDYAGYGGGDKIYEFTPDGTRSTFVSGLNHPIGLAFQPVPELLGVITNGTFQLRVVVPSPYYSTVVQVSTNLVNWVNIYTNTPPFTLTNLVSAASPQCFYRAVLGH
jgi:sugar lactone lactonase YvrE